MKGKRFNEKQHINIKHSDQQSALPSQSMTSKTDTPPSLRKSLYTSCMHALDDVGWNHGFSFSSYGVELGVRVTDPEILDQLRSRLPYGSKSSKAAIVERLFSVVVLATEKPSKTRYNFYWDHMLFGPKLTLSQLLDKLDAMASLAIAELSMENLFVHAGVVEWQGKAILIPGRSHSGKSTLVAELVKIGARYYSDEFAVLDDLGHITAYPKPISLRDPKTKRQKDVSVNSFGGQVGDDRLPVGLVVISQYEPGTRWEPRELSAGNGVLHLLDNTHSAQRAPDRAMQVLKQAVTNARIINSPRGEAKDVAASILSAVNM